MHPIDLAILRGTLTREQLATAELAKPGGSYWSDHVLAGHDRETAARLAARDMGTVLRSLARV